MGTIWIEGQFKNSAKPVKIIGGQSLLNDYVTKADLQKAVEDLTASIEGIDHNVEEETLIIQ